MITEKQVREWWNCQGRAFNGVESAVVECFKHFGLLAPEPDKPLLEQVGEVDQLLLSYTREEIRTHQAALDEFAREVLHASVESLNKPFDGRMRLNRALAAARNAGLTRVGA